MNPISWILGNLKLTGIIAAALAAASALFWFADKIGDSRELDVINRQTKQENAANDAAAQGRNRARECHALGPDRLWNVAEERCDRIAPMPRPGG